MNNKGENTNMDKLLGTSNYFSWRRQAIGFLVIKNVWHVIKNKEYKFLTSQEVEQDDEQAKAIAYLNSIISNNILDRFINKYSANALWTALEEKFQVKDILEISAMEARLNEITLNNSSNAENYVTRLSTAFQELSAAGSPVAEAKQALQLIKGLSAEYFPFIQSIRSTEMENLTFDGVSKNLEHLERIKEKQPESDKLLKASIKPRKKGKCNYCKIEGHWEKECRKKKADLDKGKTLLTKQNESFLFNTATKSSNRDPTLWFIDSGASYSMTWRKETFLNLSPIEKNIQLPDGSTVSIKGVGDIEIPITLNNRTTLKKIRDVRYVPNLQHQLISEIAAVESGCTVEKKGEKCYFKRNGITILCGTKEPYNGGLYTVDVEYKINIVQPRVEKESINEWHSRMSHLNKDTIDQGIAKLAIEGVQLSSKQWNACESCILAKSHKQPQPTSAERKVSHLGEVVSADICGPIDPKSNGGNKYLSTIIDSFSRYCNVKPLPTKESSQILQHFKDFHKEFERQTGTKLKTFRSDNGSEYTSKEFEAYLKENGIRHEKTAPYSPAQNGIAERKNLGCRFVLKKETQMEKL